MSSVRERVVAGLWLATGAGAFAGALEAVALAARLKLSLGFAGFAALGLAAMGVMAAVGLGLGLLTTPLHLALRVSWASTALTLQLTAITGLLCSWYLGQAAWVLWLDEQPIPAAAMAAMPLGFAGLAFFNARYAMRRVELGPGGLAGWVGRRALPLAVLAGAAIVGIAALAHAVRNTGGSRALSDDRNAVIVAVDGWARPEVRGPGLEALTATGTWFADAVTPAPDPRAANATLLTGLHPLRHRVLSDDHPLTAPFTSVAELLEAEGWATGAFVSQGAVDADSGLAQGFRVYDDDFAPWLAGLYRINLLKWVAPAGRGRAGDRTLDRFEAWLGQKAELPFFAWVQLPPGADPDGWVGRIDRALQAAGVADETLVVVAGTRGQAQALHLAEPVVRVPLALRVPGLEARVPQVQAQVRLMDIPGSIATWLGLAPLDAEGVDLVDYAAGRREATVWCALIGRSPAGDPLLGLRNNGLKYLRDLGDGSERLYHLPADPTEAHDISAEQPDTLRAARMLIGPDALRFEQLLGRR